MEKELPDRGWGGCLQCCSLLFIGLPIGARHIFPAPSLAFFVFCFLGYLLVFYIHMREHQCLTDHS